MGNKIQHLIMLRLEKKEYKPRVVPMDRPVRQDIPRNRFFHFLILNLILKKAQNSIAPYVLIYLIINSFWGRKDVSYAEFDF